MGKRSIGCNSARTGGGRWLCEPCAMLLELGCRPVGDPAPEHAQLAAAPVEAWPGGER
jgi:hypothetical protein